MKRPVVVVVGRGRLARSLAPRLAAAGWRVSTVAARAAKPGRRAADSALNEAGVVLLAVPDAALRTVAAGLARRIDGWEGRVVLHHAGALGPGELAPLAKRGAALGVLHPFQSLAAPALAARTLAGSAARIEGDPRAVRAARRIARDLGLLPLRVPARLSPSARAAYHAAASYVGNDLLALLHGGATLLAEAGVGEREALRALVALARGVLSNVEALGLRASLTGPVARGDAQTLAAQLARMARSSPDAAQAHGWLSRELLRLASAAGLPPPAARRALKRLLQVVAPSSRRGL